MLRIVELDDDVHDDDRHNWIDDDRNDSDVHDRHDDDRNDRNIHNRHNDKRHDSDELVSDDWNSRDFHDRDFHDSDELVSDDWNSRDVYDRHDELSDVELSDDKRRRRNNVGNFVRLLYVLGRREFDISDRCRSHSASVLWLRRRRFREYGLERRRDILDESRHLALHTAGRGAHASSS